MNDWWTALTLAQQIFWGIAIVSSTLLVLQFILSFIGAEFDSGDADTHADLGHIGDHHLGDHHLDSEFTILSIRGVIAFFSFFGWGGVLVLGEGGSLLLALFVALVAGFAAMFLVAGMMYWISKMTQAGNLELTRAIQSAGEVYLSIPEARHGAGKVHVRIGSSLREMDAVTEGEPLPNGAKVRVLEILDDNVLLVEKIEALPPPG
jgi:hypothetical protein